MTDAPLLLLLRQVRDVAQAIRTFELVDPRGAALPAFTAGAHLDVHLPNGLLRQYSLVNDETEHHRYVIAVQREPDGRGGSAAMHALPAGAELPVSAPRNAFGLDHAAAHAILIAGGIGVTPILSMARSLARRRQPFALHYAARSAARLAFREEIAALGAEALLYCGDDAPARRLSAPDIVRAAPAGAHVYLCGPGGLMAAVKAACQTRPDITLHTEHFAASAERPAAVGGFTVVLARSGKRIGVGPGETILAALRAQGVDVETSCESGVCGTCLTKVLSGAPVHRDYVLSDADKAANNILLVCVSGAEPGSEIVLDR